MLWFSNPVLIEWRQATRWTDLQREHDLKALLSLARILAFRATPMSIALLLLGFWLVGRIPNGTGPLPLHLQITFAGSMLVLALPNIALRLGLGGPKPGVAVQVRLRARGIELVRSPGDRRLIPWSTFDAFDVGRWEGFDLLTLRWRQRWPFRGRRPRIVRGFETGALGGDLSLVRHVLLERGLAEQELGAPLVIAQEPRGTGI